MRRLVEYFVDGIRPESSGELWEDIHIYGGAILAAGGLYWVYEPSGLIALGAFLVYMGTFHTGV